MPKGNDRSNGSKGGKRGKGTFLNKRKKKKSSDDKKLRNRRNLTKHSSLELTLSRDSGPNRQHKLGLRKKDSIDQDLTGSIDRSPVSNGSLSRPKTEFISSSSAGTNRPSRRLSRERISIEKSRKNLLTEPIKLSPRRLSTISRPRNDSSDDLLFFSSPSGTQSRDSLRRNLGNRIAQNVLGEIRTIDSSRSGDYKAVSIWQSTVGPAIFIDGLTGTRKSTIREIRQDFDSVVRETNILSPLRDKMPKDFYIRTYKPVDVKNLVININELDNREEEGSYIIMPKGPDESLIHLKLVTEREGPPREKDFEDRDQSALDQAQLRRSFKILQEETESSTDGEDSKDISLRNLDRFPPPSLDKWKEDTASRREANRGKNQPTILKIDDLLNDYENALENGEFDDNPERQLQKLTDIRFTIDRWLATYSGSREEAATMLQNEIEPQIKFLESKDIRPPDHDRYPKIEIDFRRDAPRVDKLVKKKGDKYLTIGMLRDGGLLKDWNISSLPGNLKKAKESFDVRGLVYMDEKIRKRYEIKIIDGLMYRKEMLKDTEDRILLDENDDEIVYDLLPLDTNGGTFVFVMDAMGRIFSADKNEVAHHSSFLAGNPAAAAGMMIVDNGQISYINNHSGHYQPPRDFIEQFKRELSEQNVNLDAVVEADDMWTIERISTVFKRRDIYRARLYPSGIQGNPF